MHGWINDIDTFESVNCQERETETERDLSKQSQIPNKIQSSNQYFH